MTNRISFQSAGAQRSKDSSPADSSPRSAATGRDVAASTIARAHAGLMAVLAVPVPAPIPLEPYPTDFTARGMYARLVICAAREYLLAIVSDAADNSTGAIDGAELTEAIDASLNDLAADIDGAFAAEVAKIEDDRYDGMSMRGPHRARS